MRAEALTAHLRDLGLMAGDVVLVHSSMRGLGHVEGGPGVVIDALLTVVGDEGTILFPTLTGSKNDGPEHPPSIDRVSTPCAPWVGIMPETARQRADAVRSIHPTHSVTALGANRESWTQGHERGASPCDRASPYYRLMELGGKILLLGGVTHESNTSLHCIEEIAGVPYHLQPEFTDGRVSLPNGERVVVPNRLHLWQNRYSELDLERDFTLAVAPLIAAGAQRSHRIGRTESTLIDAGAMRDVLIPLLQRGPLFLLKQV